MCGALAVAAGGGPHGAGRCWPDQAGQHLTFPAAWFGARRARRLNVTYRTQICHYLWLKGDVKPRFYVLYETQIRPFLCLIQDVTWLVSYLYYDCDCAG